MTRSMTEAGIMVIRKMNRLWNGTFLSGARRAMDVKAMTRSVQERLMAAASLGRFTV